MIDYKCFDMIMNKKFINSSKFYLNIIEEWYYHTDKEMEEIIIYADNMERVYCDISNVHSLIDYNMNISSVRKRKDNICFALKVNDNKMLRIDIQSIDRLSLDQRGIKCAGVIIDVEGKKEIGNCLNDTVINKLFCFLVPPTKLNIGLVLYY